MNGTVKLRSQGLQTLFDQVVSQPFNDHVALAWSQRFIIYTNNQSLLSFLHSDPTSALSNNQIDQDVFNNNAIENSHFSHKIQEQKKTMDSEAENQPFSHEQQIQALPG